MAARLFRPYGIRIAHKPAAYIKSILSKPKDKIQTMDKSNAIYRVLCLDCPKHYNGQTGRRLQTRMKEHKLLIRNRNMNSLIYVHQNATDHKMDVDHPKILAQAKTKHAREFLESWFSKPNAINRRIAINPVYWTLRDKLAPKYTWQYTNLHQSINWNYWFFQRMSFDQTGWCISLNNSHVLFIFYELMMDCSRNPKYSQNIKRVRSNNYETSIRVISV